MRFKYKGRTKEGILTKGTVEAKTRKLASEMINQKVDTVFYIKETGKTSVYVLDNISRFFINLAYAFVALFGYETKKNTSQTLLSTADKLEMVHALKNELIRSGVPDYLADSMANEVDFDETDFETLAEQYGMTTKQAEKIQKKPKEKTTKVFGLTVPTFGIKMPDKVTDYMEERLSKKKLPLMTLFMFTLHLALLNKTGVVFIDSLNTLRATSKNQRLKEILEKTVFRMLEGRSFSEAIRPFENDFGTFYISMVQLGEEAGKIWRVLEDVNKFVMMRLTVRQEITKALIYPVILVFLMVLIMIGGNFYLVPRYREMFSGLDIELPELTKFIFAVSDYIGYILGITGLVVAVMVTVLTRSVKARYMFKVLIDKIGFKLPLTRKAVLDVAMYQLTLTLLICLKNHISLINAFDYAKSTIGNTLTKKDIEEVSAEYETGQALALIVSNKKYICDNFKSSLVAGVKSGALIEILEEYSLFYEKQVKSNTEKLVKIIEPLTFLGIAVVVGPFIIGMYLPLQTMTSGF